jgi:hypothetical protein
MPRPGDQQEAATIYFFRLQNYMGSASKMTIRANDQPVVRLRNGCYFKYELQPGDYIFSLAFGSSSSVRLNVEPGKEYYIKCYLNMGFWSQIPILELVDPVSGKATMEGNRLFQQPSEPISLKPRNSKLGMVMEGAAGFESLPWFVDTNGDNVSLSTGGGFGIGVLYGYQFNKYFDLSADCAFMGSTLSRTLSNASGSFNRMVITVTPSVIMPIKGGEAIRLKLGAGPGLYSFGTMKIDGSRIGGSKYTLNYNSALGVHVTFLIEARFMERGSFEMGIRYTHVRYNYDSSGSSYSITEPKLLNPDGSGIGFFMGYYFLF